MQRVAFLLLVLAGTGLDLWSKDRAFQAVPYPSSRVVVVDGLFSIVHVRNPGMAWSLFQKVDRRVWIGIRGALVTALVIFYLRRGRVPWWANAGFGLVVGGAIGNLYDNCFAEAGKVRDFLLFTFGTWDFPVFNVADSLITVGAPALLIYFAKHDGGAKAVPVAAAESPADRPADVRGEAGA